MADPVTEAPGVTRKLVQGYACVAHAVIIRAIATILVFILFVFFEAVNISFLSQTNNISV